MSIVNEHCWTPEVHTSQQLTQFTLGTIGRHILFLVRPHAYLILQHYAPERDHAAIRRHQMLVSSPVAKRPQRGQVGFARGPRYILHLPSHRGTGARRPVSDRWLVTREWGLRGLN